MAEPIAKRRRSDDTNGEDPDGDRRCIELDMTKYGEWVRKLSDAELVNIFEIGLKIKESTMLTVDVSQDFLGKALSSQMEPVKENVASIETEVKNQLQKMQESVSRDVGKQVDKMSSEVRTLKDNVRTDIGSIETAFVKKVNDVVSKASELNTLDSKIKESEKRLKERLEKSEERLTGDIKSAITELNEISRSLERPKVKGSAAEKQVINILQEHFPNFTVSDVSKQPRSGDILAETPRQSKIMIEVKNRASANVPTTEVDRFKEDLASSPGVKVGILFSMKTGIANKASHGKFQVKFDTNQYQIYVPNAGKEEHLVVWSVLLADELAQAVHGELRTTQVQELQQLFDEFKESKDLEKTCRDNLQALEKSTESLKKNLDSFMKTVGITRRKLENLLKGWHVRTVKPSTVSQQASKVELSEDSYIYQ